MVYLSSYFLYYSFKFIHFLNARLYKNILTLFYTLFSWPFSINKLNGVRESDRCYVIMTGPSLAKEDLGVIGSDDVITSSAFWKHPFASQLKIAGYVFYDANYFQLSSHTKSFFVNLKESVSANRIFAPSHLLRPINKKFLESLGFSVLRTFHVGFDSNNLFLNSFWPGYAGVGAYALAIALSMGYKEIILLGYDHDYLVNRDVDKHFYDGPTIEGTKDIPLLERAPYHIEMMNNYKLWKNYIQLKKMAERRNVRIVNATRGSYLDVFDHE